VRLVAKQLYHEELVDSVTPTKDSGKHLPKTPQHGRLDVPVDLKRTTTPSPARRLRKDTVEKLTVESDSEHCSEPVELSEPPGSSVHRHFLDSSQLHRADLAADSDKSPARNASVRSPSRREMTESVRRSPRLIAKQENLLLEAPAAKTNVRPADNIYQLF